MMVQSSHRCCKPEFMVKIIKKRFFNFERNPQAVKELENLPFFCSLMFSMEFNPWKNYSTGGWIPHSINLMAINCGYTLRWFEIFTKLSKYYLELFLKRRAVLIFQQMHWIPMSQWRLFVIFAHLTWIIAIIPLFIAILY